ncbi:MAG: S8 family serine peptidase [Nanoarchaeota archaeon]|nr:S8 family serine peptidase [Nanoarchaeota archaeon]
MKRWIFWVFGIILIALLLPLMFAVEGDVYETDDDWQHAQTVLTNGTWYSHTFHNATDFDFINFTGVAGVQYTIETSNQTAVDPHMTLYDTDGTTKLDYNDDIEAGYQRNSRIVVDCTANSTYYVNISELYGNTGNYQVRVLEQGRMVPSLVSHTATSVVTKGRVFEFTSSVTCLSADCYNVTATLDPEPFAAVPIEKVGAIKPKLLKYEKAEPKIHSMLEEQEKVDVIVIMKQKDVKVKAKKAALSAAQYSLLSAKGFEKKHEYRTFNGFSGKVTTEALAALEANPDVEAVYFDREVHAFAEQPNMLQINADDTWATQVNGVNITGIGETICILDTGIAYDHADFGSCARTPNINGGSCPKVVGGYDYVNTDNDPYDDNGHGSHVAGIAASQSTGYLGVAPSARIVMMKVLNSSGSGSSSNVIAGIDWCVSHAVALNITAISMSLGIPNKKYEFFCPNAAEKASINAAVAAGVPVFIAAGNNHFRDGISTPACIENATSVGAVNSADSITFNRGRILDMLAPGVSITSTNYTGTHVAMSGTSMSTPHAAGFSALLKQYAKLKFSRNLTAEQIKHNMITSGLMVYDSLSKLSFPRIDALASIEGKGIIPTTVGAKPFYSLTPNPHNASCLSHIVQGQTCNTTWQVNVTGDANDTYAFFVIYTTDYKRNDSAKVNLSIADAIAITLNSPSSGLVSSNTSQIFNCSAISPTLMSNITLYGSFNGTWLANSTRNITGGSNSSQWQLNLAEGSYEWNCRACNSERCDFASSNYSLVIDTISPQFANLSYTAVIELGDEQSISINITDSYLSTVNISYSGSNYTMSNISSNFSYSYTPLANGTVNFTIYAFDAAGNSNSTSAFFVANDTTDEPRIKSVSLASSTIAYGNNQTITAYIYDQWQPLAVYLDHNSTNITMPNTSIANYSYTWIVSQCGTVAYRIFAQNMLNNSNATSGTFTSNNCCGNGVCDGSDTCSSCTADCGACPATTSSGGGGGGGATIKAAGNTESILIKDVSPSNPAVVSISNPEIPVTSVKIDVAAEIPQARVQVTALKEPPSSVSSVSAPVYRYLDITTGIQAKDILNAEVVFYVPSTWLLENGILKEEVVLLRFNSGKWVEMPTSYLMAKDSLHYYTASVGGFSVFAISRKAVEVKKPEPIVEMPKAEEITASAVAVPMEPTKAPEPWYKIKAPWISLLAVLFAACIVEAIYLSHFIHLRHKKNKDKN